MFGFELDKARRERRRELRAQAQEQLTREGVALDLDWLLRVINDDASHLGHMVRRPILIRWASEKGATDAELARAFGITVEMVGDERNRGVLADPTIAAEIDARVERELPETEEPGRFQPAAI